MMTESEFFSTMILARFLGAERRVNIDGEILWQTPFQLAYPDQEESPQAQLPTSILQSPGDVLSAEQSPRTFFSEKRIFKAV